jgi:hypothetical protein
MTCHRADPIVARRASGAPPMPDRRPCTPAARVVQAAVDRHGGAVAFDPDHLLCPAIRGRAQRLKDFPNLFDVEGLYRRRLCILVPPSCKK